ncbi:MAG: hypothetical protein ACYDB7_00210 [Mycobacteriales bacterium]
MPPSVIDRRRPDQICRAARRVEGDFEHSAATVLARLTGASVELVNDGSSASMPDLRIAYPGADPDRPGGVGEVWRDIASVHAAGDVALHEAGYAFPAPGLRREWHVGVAGEYHHKRLVQELPRLLTVLEEDNVDLTQVWELDGAPDLPGCPGLVAELRALGVQHLGARLPPEGGGLVRLGSTGVHGPAVLDWEGVLGWLEATLAGSELADVRYKLASCGAEERHVVVGLSWSRPCSVNYALREEPAALPPRAPGLPAEITHVWLLPAQFAGRCLVWWPGRGWLDAERQWASG